MSLALFRKWITKDISFLGLFHESLFKRTSIFHRFATISESPADGKRELLRKQHNKLRYRSHQRGLLEMDVLLGKWSDRMLAQMDQKHLEEFEQLLEEETPLLYKWVTGQQPFPDRLRSNDAFMNFYRFVQCKVKENCQAASRNKSHAQWLRGWLDKGNQS